MDTLLKQKAAQIKLVICDVDGVLTDGKLYLTNDGLEMKAFHSQDGLGLKLLLQNNIEVALITGRQSNLVSLRAKELGIKWVYQGQRNKRAAYNTLKETLNLNDQNIAYIGDDLPDLPLIHQVGLGIAVANANHLIEKHCDWQTTEKGGNGAVREVCDLILTAQNKLANIEKAHLVW